MGVHREAEFTRNHAPAYARQKGTRGMGMRNYPFVRSYDWYYMNPERRAEMLKEPRHEGYRLPAGAREYRGNLRFERLRNGYLALEAPELVDLVDMMRHFRNTEARLHVREEIPFYTGRRVNAADVAECSRE